MPHDVFLSHNSKDKPLVGAVYDWLKSHGVRCWYDQTNLEPGDRLPDELGKAMEESRAALVFIGPDGEGPWQGEEIDTLLNKAIKLSRQKDEFRIIPVLVGGADETKLRWFLKTRLWVDLSKLSDAGITDNEGELHRLRRAILGSAEESAVPEDPAFNPYMGLAAFQPADAKFFFGRAKVCRELAAKLKEWRFACVVGPSGNGKSSLARAGLATDAAEDAFPGVRTFERVILVPGPNLLRAFIEQLAARLPDAERANHVAQAMERINPGDRKLTARDWASRLNEEFRAWFPHSQQRVLFLVDQFEEVFTQRDLSVADDSERQEHLGKILDCLALLATQGDKRWHWVFTLRSDFYPRCRLSPAFWDLVSAQRLSLHLDELSREGFREAIKGPAARAGAYLEAGLVETVVNDVYEERGSMPLLQLALHQLWRLRQGACLTHAAYTTLGGVTNALQNRAESALKHLSKEKSEYLEIARNLFLRLTALGEGVSDSRRRVDRRELDWEGTRPQDTEHVLAELTNADNRLLVADAQSVEVTHEVLIRECDTIRGWIEAARKEIPALRRLTHAARRWEENQRAAVFLGAADPPRELKQWAGRTTLRLTRLEREYWQASRAQRAKDHREKRVQQQERRRQAEALLRSEEEKRKQAETARRKAFLITTIAIGLAVVAGVSWLFAGRAKEAAELALTRSFVRTVGTSGEATPSADEHEALWELAELDTANENVRKEVINRWTQSDDLLVRALNADSRGLHAAIGLNPSLWALFHSKANVMAPHLVTALTGRQDYWEAGRSEKVRTTLEGIAAWLDSTNAALIAKNLVPDLRGLEELDSDRRNTLGIALAALATRLDSTNATPVAKSLVSTLRDAEDPVHLHMFSLALVALAPRLDPTNAAPLAMDLAKIVKSPQGTNFSQNYALTILGTALATFAARLDSTNAKTVSGPAAWILASAMEKYAQEGDPLVVGSFGTALGALAAQLDSANATALGGPAASVLVAKMEEDTGDERASLGLRYLSPALAALAACLDITAAEPLANRVVVALKGAWEWDDDRLSALVSALGSLSPLLNPIAAAPLAKSLAMELKNIDESKPIRLKSLSLALEALVVQLSPKDASALTPFVAPVANRLVTTMERKESELDSRLGDSLKVLAARLDSTTAAPLANRLASAAALENGQGTNAYRLGHLGSALGALVMRLSPADAAAISIPVASAVAVALTNHPEVSYRAESLQTALAVLATQVLQAEQARLAALSYLFQRPISPLPKDAKLEFRDRLTVSNVCVSLRTTNLVEVLKWPFCVGEAQKLVLAELERRTQRQFDGDVWKFVAQAESLGIPGLDRAFLARPAKRPQLTNAIAELKALLPPSAQKP